MTEPKAESLRCSFCNKSQDDVRKLIAGPTVFICDECVRVCEDIIADDGRLEADRRDAPPAASSPRRLDLGGSIVLCSLCRLPVPVADVIMIENRGVLCPGCIAAVRAATATVVDGTDSSV